MLAESPMLAGVQPVARLVAGMRAAPYYPVVVLVAFVIDIWRTTSFDAVMLARPLGIAVPAAIAVTAVAAVVARSRDLGGVIAGAVVVGFVGGDDLRIPLLSVAAILALIVLERRHQRANRRVSWPRITSLLNLVSVVMLTLLSLAAVSRAISLRQTTSDPAPPVSVVAHPAASLPHIVIILLDEHGRQDLLAERYDEDISGFVADLETRGFDVSDLSKSNYMSTRLTLASMFNFAYLSHLDLPSQLDPGHAAALRSHLEQNRAFDALRTAGYRIVTVNPGFDGASLRSADLFIDGGQIDELEAALIINTVLRPGLDLAAPDVLASQIRDRVRWNLDPDNWLPDLTSSRGAGQPTFLFVHVPSPHQPFLFGRDGTPKPAPDMRFVDETEYSDRTPEQLAVLAQAYADQLAFVDDLAIAAIDRVIASTPPNTVVIVMSDHGAGIHIDWDNLTTTDTRERFGTLFAARTPGSPGLFGEAPTPVNLVPTLLNEFAETSLPTQANAFFLGVPGRNELLEIPDPDAE